MPKIIRVCNNCGKEFLINESRLKHGGGKNCSRECANESLSKTRNKRVTKTCIRCGKEFKITNAALRGLPGRGKYCSLNCKNPIIVKNCKNCGAEFRVSPNSKRKFCSKSCGDKSDRKVTAILETVERSRSGDLREKFINAIKERSKSDRWKSSPHFQRGSKHPKYNGKRSERQGEMRRYAYHQWRKKVFERDNYTCQRCFARGGRLNAHHIEPWASNPEKRYSIENGVTLCYECHKIVHKSPRPTPNLRAE